MGCCVLIASVMAGLLAFTRKACGGPAAADPRAWRLRAGPSPVERSDE